MLPSVFSLPFCSACDGVKMIKNVIRGKRGISHFYEKSRAVHTKFCWVKLPTHQISGVAAITWVEGPNFKWLL